MDIWEDMDKHCIIHSSEMDLKKYFKVFSSKWPIKAAVFNL